MIANSHKANQTFSTRSTEMASLQLKSNLRAEPIMQLRYFHNTYKMKSLTMPISSRIRNRIQNLKAPTTLTKQEAHTFQKYTFRLLFLGFRQATISNLWSIIKKLIIVICFRYLKQLILDWSLSKISWGLIFNRRKRRIPYRVHCRYIWKMLSTS